MCHIPKHQRTCTKPRDRTAMRDQRLGANKYMVAVMILWARSVPVVNGFRQIFENVTNLPHRTSDPHACCHNSSATLFRRA